ncbi:uncharacterized protein K452DRAFT_8003 [Aplosporella prunicola CBS 121167]|uniref:Uncharacterized protein n=1 Tax=Aplosporella prunicola CBS 121167 TaxID=1176127 RepID=A0A6A6BX47_9PEZI|nr:uncharacterized protein K452DRAFT_8003 [Aplosporella prunicola CBS 121167]KAF2147477.1 hypothetical protein K452DRAFT_8003 [Aplosporella prunicola CBS 121167]
MPQTYLPNRANAIRDLPPPQPTVDTSTSPSPSPSPRRRAAAATAQSEQHRHRRTRTMSESSPLGRRKPAVADLTDQGGATRANTRTTRHRGAGTDGAAVRTKEGEALPALPALPARFARLQSARLLCLALPCPHGPRKAPSLQC